MKARQWRCQQQPDQGHSWNIWSHFPCFHGTLGSTQWQINENLSWMGKWEGQRMYWWDNRPHLALQMPFCFCSSSQKNLEVVIAMCEIVRVGKIYFESKTCLLRKWKVKYLVSTILITLKIFLFILHKPGIIPTTTDWHFSYNNILIR